MTWRTLNISTSIAPFFHIAISTSLNKDFLLKENLNYFSFSNNFDKILLRSEKEKKKKKETMKSKRVGK